MFYLFFYLSIYLLSSQYKNNNPNENQNSELRTIATNLSKYNSQKMSIKHEIESLKSSLQRATFKNCSECNQLIKYTSSNRSNVRQEVVHNASSMKSPSLVNQNDVRKLKDLEKKLEGIERLINEETSKKRNVEASNRR